MIEIPIFKDLTSNFTQNMDLDGVNVTITLRFNIRSGSWFMDISTNNNTLSGIRLNINYLLLEPYKSWVNDIIGDFIVLPYSDVKTNFSYDDLGTVYGLFYVNPDEITEWKAYYGIQ